jgi:hypothetical protein
MMSMKVGQVAVASLRVRRLHASVLIADLAVSQPTERLLARALEAARHHRLLELDFARPHIAVKDCRFTKRLSTPPTKRAVSRASPAARLSAFLLPSEIVRVKSMQL